VIQAAKRILQEAAENLEKQPKALVPVYIYIRAALDNANVETGSMFDDAQSKMFTKHLRSKSMNA